jgi:hypothetical protein
MFVFKKAEADKQAAKVAGVRPHGGAVPPVAPLHTPMRGLTCRAAPLPVAPQTYRDVAFTGAVIFTLFAVLRIA